MIKSLTGIALGYSIFKLMEALAGYIVWAWLNWQEKKLKKEKARLDQLEKKLKEKNDRGDNFGKK